MNLYSSSIKLILLFLIFTSFNISCNTKTMRNSSNSQSKYQVYNDPFQDLEDMANSIIKSGGVAAVGQGISRRQDIAKKKAVVDAQGQMVEVFNVKVQHIKKNLLKEGDRKYEYQINEGFSSLAKNLARSLLKSAHIQKVKYMRDKQTRQFTARVVVAIEAEKVNIAIFDSIHSTNNWLYSLLVKSNLYLRLKPSDYKYSYKPTKKNIQPIKTKKETKQIQAFPADLQIENLVFTEPSKNRALDGLEKGEIYFDLVNKGRGSAHNIEIKLTPISSNRNIKYKANVQIRKIEKKSRKTVTIPITADISVKTLNRQFRIDITEQNGFDPDPAIINFETLAFQPPDLRIEQIAIDDNEDREGEGYSYGNGNSIIEPGESIEVTAYVQNFGAGEAEDVKAEVLVTDNNSHLTYPDQGKKYNLGDIKSGDYKKIEFYFYTSRRYDESTLPISIKLTESKGMFGKKNNLNLKLGKRTQNIVDVSIARSSYRKTPRKIRKIDNIYKLSDVDKNIPKSSIINSNTLAIIIGIEEYKYAPKVDFAANDAQTFYKYAKELLGIPERNIYFRMNDNATSGEFNKIFSENGWIARRLKKNKTDLIIYYSGHGAPDTRSKEGFLIPSDIDPNYASTGYSIDKLYKSLNNLSAKSVTIFLDACFSGESRSNEMLIAGIRPISISIRNPILNAQNMSVFSASTGDQYSTSYPKKKHGLFTYFLLKGLKGDAKGRDKTLTMNELFKYVYEKVTMTAGYLDKEQTPTFYGKDKNRVFLKY